MIWTLAVNELSVSEETLTPNTVVPAVLTKINISLVIDFLKNREYYLFVFILGSTNKTAKF